MTEAAESHPPDLLARLHDMLQAEREEAYLTCLDTRLIDGATAEIARLTEQIRASNSYDRIDECDAISEHLDEILEFRMLKIARMVGFRRPENMTPPETAYFDTLEAASRTLRQAWRIAA